MGFFAGPQQSRLTLHDCLQRAARSAALTNRLGFGVAAPFSLMAAVAGEPFSAANRSTVPCRT
jgi:hypothetical protein